MADQPDSTHMGQRKMKRGKGLPTKVDEIVADAAREELEGSELSPEEWERIIAGARRYDEPPEEMSPEEWDMVERTLYPHRRPDTTNMPRACHETRQKRKRKGYEKHQ